MEYVFLSCGRKKLFIVAISDKYFCVFVSRFRDINGSIFYKISFSVKCGGTFWEFHRNILFHKRAPNPSIIQPSSRRSHRLIKWEIDQNYCFDFFDIASKISIYCCLRNISTSKKAWNIFFANLLLFDHAEPYDWIQRAPHIMISR